MKVVVVGATGTLGRELVSKLSLDSRYTEIVCLSRDELKQQEMAQIYRGNPRVSFVLGDIRFPESLDIPFTRASAVFHVAALKHVDLMERNPQECLRTNVDGTLNVARKAIQNKVHRVIFSSTDKAVDPINTYGLCKALSERILTDLNRTQDTTKFLIYRWGNVLGSRGSVVHSFLNTLKKEQAVYLTNQSMTRFWIKIEDAVRFMLSTCFVYSGNEVLIPEIKSAPVLDLARAVARVAGVATYREFIIGERPGEKLHEDMVSRQVSGATSSFNCQRLSTDELEDLVRPFVEAAS